MTDPNRVIVYSPTGEGPFEVTRLNAHDLTTHAGWGFAPPNNVVPVAAPEPEPEAVVEEEANDGADDEGSTEASEETHEDEATETEDDFEEIEEVVGEEAPIEAAVIGGAKALRTAVEDFDDLEDRKAVFDYIEDTFPGNKVDGRLNRTKLIDLAIKLAENAQ